MSQEQIDVKIVRAPFTITIGGVTVEEGTLIVDEEGETLLLSEDEFNERYNVDLVSVGETREDLSESLSNIFDGLPDGDDPIFSNPQGSA